MASITHVSSESKHNTGRVAEAVLAIAEAAGKSGRQRIGRGELRAQVVHLDGSDR